MEVKLLMSRDVCAQDKTSDVSVQLQLGPTMSIAIYILQGVIGNAINKYIHNIAKVHADTFR